MSQFPITLKPFGNNAILIEWPQRVDASILQDILTFQDFLRDRLEDTWEMVPAYNSLTLIQLRSNFDQDQMHKQLLDWYSVAKQDISLQRYVWKIPVCYDLEFGIDLPALTKTLALSIEELIEQHTTHIYTVYGIGFLPGFMYLGGLPKVLETPRRKSPRLHVKKGAVGLAAKQTGIYPQDSPGGWNIIGSCPVPMFNPNSKNPCFVSVGDKVQFTPIERAEYELRKIEAEVGIYAPQKKELHA
ncbi:MAG: 5-oxoprolinase subunit PxpB [Bacteroidota bacterium]